MGILKSNFESSIKIVDFYNKTEEFVKSYLDSYDFYQSYFDISSSSYSKGVLTKYFRKLDKSTRTIVACKILKDFNIKQSLNEANKWTKQYMIENNEILFEKYSKLSQESIDTITKTKEANLDDYIQFINKNLESFSKKLNQSVDQ